jgi:hypothetical protein
LGAFRRLADDSDYNACLEAQTADQAGTSDRFSQAFIELMRESFAGGQLRSEVDRRPADRWHVGLRRLAGSFVTNVQVGRMRS